MGEKPKNRYALHKKRLPLQHDTSRDVLDGRPKGLLQCVIVGNVNGKEKTIINQ